MKKRGVVSKKALIAKTHILKTYHCPHCGEEVKIDKRILNHK